jgi:hypothetical protein
MTVINILCSTYAHSFSSPLPGTKYSILLKEMYSRSPGFMKSWPRCLNLNVVKASHSQRTCKAVSDACLHPLHPAMSASPSFNRCPLKWQCPVSSPVIILSWFLLKLTDSLALVTEGLWRKPFACLCAQNDWQYSSSSYSSSPWTLLRSYKWMWGSLPG